jgi:UDP-2,3-diacylglucosamine hydrolase
VQQLYILGDLFDVWIGDDINSVHQMQVANALRTLADTGTQIFFMKGNRDFLVTPHFLNLARAQLLPDPTIILLHGSPTLLTHGDQLCTQDIAYQRYRKIAQHPLTRFLVLHLPITWREKLAKNLRQKSKGYQADVNADILDVTPDAVNHLMQIHHVSQLIHGHVHRPKIHQEVHGNRLVLGDWHQQGSFIRSTPDGITLESYSLASY